MKSILSFFQLINKEVSKENTTIRQGACRWKSKPKSCANALGNYRRLDAGVQCLHVRSEAGGAREDLRYSQQQWQHSHSLTFFWAYEKQEENPEEDDTAFTKVRRPVCATSILAQCSRFDQERDLKLEMVAHPKKREQRPLLNFSHISSSGTKGW